MIKQNLCEARWITLISEQVWVLDSVKHPAPSAVHSWTDKSSIVVARAFKSSIRPESKPGDINEDFACPSLVLETHGWYCVSFMVQNAWLV